MTADQKHFKAMELELSRIQILSGAKDTIIADLKQRNELLIANADRLGNHLQKQIASLEEQLSLIKRERSNEE